MIFKPRGYYTISRGECVYYASRDHVLLNPEMTDGSGLAFLIPTCRWEQRAVFNIERADPTPEEEAQAIFAYYHAVGKPRGDLFVVPAYRFPNCIEDTCENRAALRAIGATWV